MAQDVFKPRPDLVDEDLFIETRQTAGATAALWELLRLSRQEPAQWAPLVVLCGEHGSGKTTVANRFSRAARRNVACDLVRDKLGSRDADRARDLRRAEEHTTGWAGMMVADHGACWEMCQPAGVVPPQVLTQALEDAQRAHPTIGLEMGPRTDQEMTWILTPAWHSPGNTTSHPTRRTSLVFVDEADRLLSVPPARRRHCLDSIMTYPRRLRHGVTMVLIGTPELTACVSEFSATQVVRIAAMEDDEEFAMVARMLFGPCGRDEVTAMHRATRGLMGPMLHLARLRGLEPPYGIAPDEILRLPVLPVPQSDEPA